MIGPRMMSMFGMPPPFMGCGCSDADEVEGSEVAMVALSELIRQNPNDVQGNVRLALQYAEEAAKQGRERRKLNEARRGLARTEQDIENLVAHKERLEADLATAEAQFAEAQKLLDALGIDDEPTTEEGKRVLYERNTAQTNIERIKKDIDASQKKLDNAGEELKRLTSLVDGLNDRLLAEGKKDS